MSETIFRSKLLCPSTWLIQGEHCNSYLVVGDKCGMLVDPSFSMENIRAYAQTYTDKPVNVAANTHSHLDHIAGNRWFPRAYMSARVLEITKTPSTNKDAFNYSMDYVVTIVGDGDKIDLGNRVLCAGRNELMGDAILVDVLMEHDHQIMRGKKGEPMVLPADVPADFHIPKMEFKRTSNFRGTTLNYDARYVYRK